MNPRATPSPHPSPPLKGERVPEGRERGKFMERRNPLNCNRSHVPSVAPRAVRAVKGKRQEEHQLGVEQWREVCYTWCQYSSYINTPN